jgi:chromosome segregation ATPase
MKRSTLLIFLGIAGLALFAPQSDYAQSAAPSNPARSKQDQAIQELLTEVHELRIALQNISVNAYRGQVMVERLRLQQGEVSRLARELNGIKNEIGELKAAQVTAKEKLDEAEKQQDKGLQSEASVNQVRTTMAQFQRQLENLSERETQLAIELNGERARLADLNKRLDALEREMLIIGQGDDSKGNPKQ